MGSSLSFRIKSTTWNWDGGSMETIISPQQQGQYGDVIVPVQGDGSPEDPYMALWTMPGADIAPLQDAGAGYNWKPQAGSSVTTGSVVAVVHQIQICMGKRCIMGVAPGLNDARQRIRLCPWGNGIGQTVPSETPILDSVTMTVAGSPSSCFARGGSVDVHA